MNFYQYLSEKYAIAHDADDSDVPIENCRAKGGPANCSVHRQELENEIAKTDDLDGDADTEAMDAAYSDAVKRGDKEAALRMVREAAAKAIPNTKVVGEDGLPLVVYHGTGAEFNTFNPKKISNSKFLMDIGIHFGSERLAAEYANPLYLKLKNSGGLGSGHRGDGSRVVNGLLNLTNPLDVTKGIPEEFAQKLKQLSGISERSKVWQLKDVQPVDLIQKAIEKDANGVKALFDKYSYDGAIYDIYTMGNERAYMVFSPSQIKSADITYDDAGNLIPLSSRFQMDNPDIRF